MDIKVQETVAAIRALSHSRPTLGLILGSGLGSYADTLENRVGLPFGDLPHFPISSAFGHAGRLFVGESEGFPTIVLQGRVHHYEGCSMDQVVYSIRVLGSLGIKNLIVTNAAGGINTRYNPGDLMLIEDHINLMGTNPLIGPNHEAWGVRFPDMSEAYDPAARALTLRVAETRGILLRRGVYAGVTGPSYETPAEIRMLRMLGADAVGMSTVPEVIAAKHMGMRVLGVSCITNMAAGILPHKLTHQDVIETAERAGHQFTSLVQGVIPLLAKMAK
jgi:purine-nucleoside phosphorylase